MHTKNSGDIRTWVTCASYALLNTLQSSEIDLIELENATGVTFGIASCAEQYHYTRMLTPFRTFWNGIDTVHKAFRIYIQRHCFYNPEELTDWLFESSQSHILIGPVNMATLTYLPFSSQYKCADHYISLHFKKNKIYLTDSEGIPHMQVDLIKLRQWLSISGIMEAKGVYHAGTVHSETIKPDKTERCKIILENAHHNLCKAEENHQGGNAFLICAELMENVSASKWVSALYYDLSYYMQRKIMFLMLDEDETVLNSKCREHILNQIALTRQCLYHIYKRDFLSSINVMRLLAAEESCIPELWKGWLQ